MAGRKTKVDEPSLDDWGTVYCAEPSCEKAIGFFPDTVNIQENDDLELYCFYCAKALMKKKQVEGNKDVKD